MTTEEFLELGVFDMAHFELYKKNGLNIKPRNFVVLDENTGEIINKPITYVDVYQGYYIYVDYQDSYKKKIEYNSFLSIAILDEQGNILKKFPQ